MPTQALQSSQKPPKLSPSACSALWEATHAAGHKAALAAIPVPLVVVAQTGPSGTGPISEKWVSPEGMCGFAWINIKPANSSLAKWLLAVGRATVDSYHGGVTIWIGQYGQSWKRKAEYARAAAALLKAHGVRAVAMDRLD